MVPLLAIFVGAATAFYLPGVAPRAYSAGEALPLLVNRLDSTESIIPYDYYAFDFCEPGEDPLTGEMAPHEGAKVSENLGQILLGERIRQSPYKITMMNDVMCRPVCTRSYAYGDKKSVLKFKKIQNAIKKDFMQHWIMDNLPAVECTSNCRSAATAADHPLYRLGFPLGCAIGVAEESMTVCTINTISNLFAEEVFINNHVDLIISYHQSAEFTGSRIVGIEVRPRSIHHESLDKMDCGRNAPPQPFSLSQDTPKVDLIYSYSVFFLESDLKWASRWDTYLQSAEGTSIHWFSIVNSLIIVVFMSGMLAVILVRTLHRDIARYNQTDNSEEATEEFGWKLVHGDVFRAPDYPMLFSVLLGTGSQIALMAIVILFFACLGFLSPATRGGLMTATVMMFVFLGTPAGYISARLYKMWGGEKWKSNVLLTAFLVPGVIFAIFFVLNLILWGEGSSAAIPFGTMLAIVTLWFFISVPLTFLGAYFGFKKAPISQPVKTNQIPRQIPPQSFFAKTLPSVFLGGILPFGCVFIQLFFILNSIWGHKMYYIFGFLFVVFLILAATTVESTILLCYFHLCSENYHWWWRAYFTAGASALGLFIYAITFYFRHMEVDGKANMALYFGYTLIMAIIYFLFTATIGFFGCFLFVRKIYSSVKVD